jgi:hypothetical protein
VSETRGGVTVRRSREAKSARPARGRVGTGSERDRTAEITVPARIKKERPIPEAKETFVRETDAKGTDRTLVIRKVLRETDQQGIFTIVDEERQLYWIRWDAIRKGWVSALCHEDGGPVPV